MNGPFYWYISFWKRDFFVPIRVIIRLAFIVPIWFYYSLNIFLFLRKTISWIIFLFHHGMGGMFEKTKVVYVIFGEHFVKWLTVILFLILFSLRWIKKTIVWFESRAVKLNYNELSGTGKNCFLITVIRYNRGSL